MSGMSIRVIGAGLGRTGTMSLKSALERLGFGPAYHMVEVIDRPEHGAAWYRTSQGGPIEWSVFDGYQSILDWPAVAYWRQLVERYPSAKVILTLRDPDSWYKSVSETIYQRLTTPVPADAPEEFRRHRAMTVKIVLHDTFDNRFEDKRHAIDVFNRHNEAVRTAIDPSHLLVFDVKEGWDPLCRFLGVPVPDEPFPRLNDSASFQAWVAEGDAARGTATPRRRTGSSPRFRASRGAPRPAQMGKTKADGMREYIGAQGWGSVINERRRGLRG